jgi:2-polyprenyl-6-methoxyphenol hydroxylase-like FAD-dependent oxidoreductase
VNSIDELRAAFSIKFMEGNTKAKVIVIGAGPVGLSTAITLHRRNINVSLVERDDRPGTHSYALALHPKTLSLLQEWGVSDRLKESSIQVDHITFCDSDGPQFDLDLREASGSGRGLLVVGQDHLEEALVSPLTKAKVPLHWSHRLASLKQDQSGVELELERLSEAMSGYAMARLEWQVDKEMKTRADYVVGADGHISMVRRKLGIEFPKIAPTQSFAVFEFKTDFDHGNKARVVFGKEGTSVLWPLPGGYCRWGFEIEEGKAEQFSRDKDRLFVQVGAHGFRSLETEMLQALIKERAPWFTGSIGQFRWRMVVRFEKRLVESFGNGSVWLAGDAGHLAAPIGMQSMNLGIQEGHILGNTIADIIEGKADRLQLEEYGRERIREWRALMGLDLSMKATEHTHPFLSQYADRLHECIPASLGTLESFARLLGTECGN